MSLALINRDLLLTVRDGEAVYHRSQVHINQSAIGAIHQLHENGFTVVLLTHQPGISRGLLDLDELEAIHEIITDESEKGHQTTISAIFYCPHETNDECYCRPPKLGLLDAIEIEFDCDCTEAIYFYITDEEKAMIDKKAMHGIACNAQSSEEQENRLQAAVQAYLQVQS